MAEGLARNWQDGPRRRPRRPSFKVQEARGAAAHGGELTRGSGCTQRPGQKGDSVGEVFRQSCKTTSKESVPLKREWWDEISAQAQATGHVPMLVVGFDAGPRRGRTDLACFDLDVAERLMSILRAVREGRLADARVYADLVKP